MAVPNSISRIAGVALLLVASTTQVWAKPPSEDQVRQLLQVLGVQKQFTQMDSQLAGMMSQQMPCVPASYWQTFVDDDGAKQLLTRMVPIYQRHFTAEDVDGLLKFYRSPLGQKVIAQMPATMTEGMQSGQDWGTQRVAQMRQDLEKQGKIDAQGRCPPASTVAPTPLDHPASKAAAAKGG